MLTKETIQFLNRIWVFSQKHLNEVITVNGNVDLTNQYLTKIPVQFGKINGYFDCGNNQLSSLKGGPTWVDGQYWCTNNKLTNLLGAPEVCNVDFYCFNNQLTSLEGCPSLIKGDLSCCNNPDLKYLWGIGRVEGEVYYDKRNVINKWIIKCSRKDIIFPYYTQKENMNWIKMTGQYFILSKCPKSIKKYFNKYILYCIDMCIL